MSVVAMTPGCDDFSSVIIPVNATRLSFRPPWVMPTNLSIHASTGCSPQGQLCARLLTGLKDRDLSLAISDTEASLLGVAIDEEAASKARLGWNGEALLQHVAIAACVLAETRRSEPSAVEKARINRSTLL